MTSTASVPAGLSEQSGVPLRMRVTPALVGLIYPVLVWSVHALSPFALMLTLLAPAACLYMLFLFSKEDRHGCATLAAYLGVGAPALYTLLGGWLDSQKWLPFRANGVWVVIWSVLALLTLIEGPKAIGDDRTRPAKLASAHGVSAAMITIFALFHLTNHLIGAFGGEAHMAVMQHLRYVYRQPAIEVVLGACILFQVTSGGILLFRRTGGPSMGWTAVLQNASGVYLMLFLASHVSAVLRARYLHQVDTNWTWLTVDNLLTDAWSVRLVPYYFLGVLVFAVHGACGLRWVLFQHGHRRIADRVFTSTLTAGGFAALIIIVVLVLGSLPR